MTAHKITVLLADDHTLVRQGFRALLSAEPDIVVVGEAETGRRAVQLATELRPDVIVMDLAMPSLNGMEATRQIVKQVPEVKVLILSSYADDEYLEQATEAGAAGYLLKQATVSEVLRAIREVSKGKSYFSPAITETLIARYRRILFEGMHPRKPADLLTSRETEVLQLIAEGKANKQIADELDLSIKTIDKIRLSLKTKLEIHDIAGLTRYAISKRVIESCPALKAA